MTEAETCRKQVRPRIEAAGWDTAPHTVNEQVSITDGRIVVAGDRVRRRDQRRPDFLLRYTRDFTLAVVEAKKLSRPAGDGMQQAKDYADILGLKFAFATNGSEILEFDYFTGQERHLTTFPAPAELWQRYCAGQGLDRRAADGILEPNHFNPHKVPRYYQQIAINRAVAAVYRGRPRNLLTLATGTGKTAVAFQICWKLWNHRWNRAGEYRRPKILFLADRNILVDDPKKKDFAPLEEAAHKIEGGNVSKSRDIYFAIYQALASGVFREYSPDFFDLVIIDECHRGSANETGNWRAILDHFAPAFQLGLTATPKYAENVDTYDYFGEPLYTYSLKQGIDDGFLAPYRVHRVVSTLDATGWRPTVGELDRFGRAVPDGEYHTKDFERVVALRARTKAIARHLTDFMKRTDRFAKTVVFCVDQEHADEMRRELNNLNADLAKQYPDYVCRVTADEDVVGRVHLDHFQDLEKRTPVILTTSQMLSTGVDMPTCRNIVLARVVGSMIEFKQIIGRGTRVKEEFGKLYFNILDYTGSATRLFADSSFDGDPVSATREAMDDEGKTVPESTEIEQDEEPVDEDTTTAADSPDDEPPDDQRDGPRKFYVDGGAVEIVAHVVYELDADGKQLRVVEFKDYAGEKVRTLYPSVNDLRGRWADPGQRAAIIEALAERGIDFETLAATAEQPDADPFDLLCHLAYNAPLRTRRERPSRNGRRSPACHAGAGRAVLNDLLEKYAEHGAAQFVLPEVLEVPPISERGNLLELANLFGGADRLREAVGELQTLLYAA